MLAPVKRLLTAPVSNRRTKPIRRVSAAAPAWRPRIETLEDRSVPSAVMTDKPDYTVGETAYFLATGFQAGEAVQFQVLHTDDTSLNTGPDHAPFNVTDGSADDLDGQVNGEVKTSWYVGADSANSAFSLTAEGLSSGSFASTTFTDTDTIPPSVVSIAAADANPTSAATVHFTVTFSEKILGNPVDASDFALATSGVSGASIASVSKVDPFNWTVTVNTGTGNGTIGLNLVDDDSITDMAGNPLGGIGLGNGNFTGEVYQFYRTAPSITSGGAGSVDENAPVDTVVYTATATDPDPGAFGQIAWSVSGGADAGAVSIDPVSGKVTLNASADFEAKSSYSFDVTATDGGGLSATQTVTVTVADVNEAPTVTSGASGSVDENAPISTVVYTAAATDPDTTAPNNTITWSVGGADAALVSIDPVSGAVTLNASADAETKSSYTFDVIATDGGGLSDTKAVTVNVNDVNEFPAVIGGETTGAVIEDTTLTVSGTLTVSDPDAGENSFQPASGSTAHGSFSVDASGNWVYTLNNADPAVQALSAGDTLPDGFTVKSFDGTEQVVSITINGNTDPVAPAPVQVAPAPQTQPTILKAVGTGSGTDAQVLVYNAATGAEVRRMSFPGFTAGLTVATGDVNGDGVSDILIGDATGSSLVGLYDGATGAMITGGYAFGPAYTGGVTVALGDFNGDGKAEIIVGAATGSSLVSVVDLASGGLLSGSAFDPGYTGGVTVAAGDLNGDGRAELIVGAATMPLVGMFDLTSGAMFYASVPLPGTPSGGLNVAAGDLNGDGRAELIVGAATGSSMVGAFDLSGGGAYYRDAMPGFTGGVRVAAAEGDMILGAGPGGTPLVQFVDGDTGALDRAFWAFDPMFDGGVYVG